MENNRSREDRQMKIGEIRDLLQAAEDQMLPDFIARFESDERSGVRQLVQRAQKRLDALEKERERLMAMHQYEEQYKDCQAICGIDEINILQATYEAMRQAVNKLSVCPDILLNDAVRIPGLFLQQVPIVKGDAKSVSIAAASIIAKVTRDRLMMEYDKAMPQYHFAANKGYGSAEHIEALAVYGASPIHRRSFITHFKVKE